MDTEKHKILEDILADAKRSPDFFEEALEHSGISSRNLMQLYMMYKFKYILGEELKKDPGWDYACMEWADRGYAKRFSDLYNPNLSVEKTKSKLFEVNDVTR